MERSGSRQRGKQERRAAVSEGRGVLSGGNACQVQTAVGEDWGLLTRVPVDQRLMRSDAWLSPESLAQQKHLKVLLHFNLLQQQQSRNTTKKAKTFSVLVQLQPCVFLEHSALQHADTSITTSFLYRSLLVHSL